MRRQEKQMAETAQIEDVLARARFCRIAMCDGDRPYVVAVNYGHESGVLFFHCATEGRKLDVLRANPHVCFQMDVDVEVIIKGNACQCTTHFRSVVGSGKATVLTEPGDKRHGLDVVMRTYAEGEQTYPDKMLARTAVVRIDIEEMSGKQSPAPPKSE